MGNHKGMVLINMKEKWSWGFGDEYFDIYKEEAGWRISFENESSLSGNFLPKEFLITRVSLEGNCLVLELPDKTFRFSYSFDIGGGVWISNNNRDLYLEKINANKEKHAAKPGGLLAPMPGIVLIHKAKEGDHVKEGAPLLVLEAMKMEYTITAPHDGIITKFIYNAGHKVPLGALLVLMEPYEVS